MKLNIEFLKQEHPLFAAFTIESSWAAPSIAFTSMDRGWGNGYIVIPHDHPWYLWINEGNTTYISPVTDDAMLDRLSKYHNAAYDTYRIGIDAHGGITYGKEVEDFNTDNEPIIPIKGYVLGFDTMHYMDDPIRWPKERVEEETLVLLRLAIAAYKPGVMAEIKAEYLND